MSFFKQSRSDKKSSNEYEAGFDDLQREAKVSEDQQKDFEKRRDEKAEKIKMDQEQIDRDKKEFEGKSEQQFQDFMDGKKT